MVIKFEDLLSFNIKEKCCAMEYTTISRLVFQLVKLRISSFTCSMPPLLQWHTSSILHSTEPLSSVGSSVELYSGGRYRRGEPQATERAHGIRTTASGTSQESECITYEVMELSFIYVYICMHMCIYICIW